MDSILQSASTLLFIVEFIIGNLGNGFIFLVNCIDWMKRRNISSVDQILTVLAISRIFLLWLGLLDWWTAIVYPNSLTTANMIEILLITWTMTNHFNIWLATSLSIFYFFKIAIFSNSLFRYLKWRFKKVILVVLVVSLILLVLNISLVHTHTDISAGGRKSNMTNNSSFRELERVFGPALYINSMFLTIPFAVSFIAFLLLIFSLVRHLRNMQRHSAGCREARAAAHLRALRMVVTFLVLLVTFFLCLLVEVWALEVKKWGVVLFVRVSIIAFPTVHSCCLILGKSKLRQALLLVLQRLRCRHIRVAL